jgi:hypothetical protein
MENLPLLEDYRNRHRYVTSLSYIELARGELKLFSVTFFPEIRSIPLRKAKGHKDFRPKALTRKGFWPTDGSRFSALDRM